MDRLEGIKIFVRVVSASQNLYEGLSVKRDVVLVRAAMTTA